MATKIPALRKGDLSKVKSDLLTNALNNALAKTATDCDGNVRSVAQAVVERLLNTALYSEDEKTATTAAKIIFDRSEGRAPLKKEEEKQEEFRIVIAPRIEDVKKLEEQAKKAAMFDMSEEDEDEEEYLNAVNDMSDGDKALYEDADYLNSLDEYGMFKVEEEGGKTLLIS